jgi:ribosomal protein S18 acetylase RimI-like enzyme
VRQEGNDIKTESLRYTIVKLQPDAVGEDVKSMLGTAMFEPTVERVNTVLEKVYFKPDTHLYGLVYHGIVLAVAGIRKGPDSIAELLHIAVRPSERNKGLGREMIQAIVKALGITQLFAETDGESVGFYRHCGFSIESLGEKYPGVERFVCTWTECDSRDRAN